MVLGTFALTTQGVTGGVLQMVNHGLIIAVLFIVIGWIYERRQTWQVNELRGLQRAAPVLAGVFTVAMLAAIGLPGLNGFVGEFLVLSGTFLTHRWWAVVATGGVVLAALYLLWAYQQAFHHEPDEADAAVRDLSWREVAVVAPLVALIVVLGVYPKPVLDRITPVGHAPRAARRDEHRHPPAGRGDGQRRRAPAPTASTTAAGPGRQRRDRIPWRCVAPDRTQDRLPVASSPCSSCWAGPSPSWRPRRCCAGAWSPAWPPSWRS